MTDPDWKACLDTLLELYPKAAPNSEWVNSWRTALDSYPWQTVQRALRHWSIASKFTPKPGDITKIMQSWADETARTTYEEPWRDEPGLRSFAEHSREYMLDHEHPLPGLREHSEDGT